MISFQNTAFKEFPMSEAAKSSVTIKKYANRRLYNTATSSYVTLDDLSKMVKEGIEFNVYDAKTSEDITRSVLTQIIVEEESKTGQNLLPINFLRHLIGFYGDNMQWLVPKYLEHSMESLAKNQEQIRTYFQSTFGGMFPFGSTFEEMGKQNLAMFERAMKIFSPFSNTQGMPEMGTPASDGVSKMEEREQAAEAAFKPSSNITSMTAMSSGPSSSSQNSVFSSSIPPMTISQPIPPASGEEVQQKIAALQRQLADLAKNKA